MAAISTNINIELSSSVCWKDAVFINWFPLLWKHFSFSKQCYRCSDGTKMKWTQNTNGNQSIITRQFNVGFCVIRGSFQQRPISIFRIQSRIEKYLNMIELCYAVVEVGLFLSSDLAFQTNYIQALGKPSLMQISPAHYQFACSRQMWKCGQKQIVHFNLREILLLLFMND